MLGPVALIKQKGNDTNENLCKTHLAFFKIEIQKNSKFNFQKKTNMNFIWIVIVIVFFLLDKGHGVDNLQKKSVCFYLQRVIVSYGMY